MESIFRQGLDEADYEVIIVNDGTKDHSMEVIEDIISAHANITVINQENLSLSVARNNGIAAAKGVYILMPDSDDLLVEESVPILLEKAIETKADLVVADFLEMTDEEIAKSPTLEQPPLTIKERKRRTLSSRSKPWPMLCMAYALQAFVSAGKQYHLCTRNQLSGRTLYPRMLP